MTALERLRSAIDLSTDAWLTPLLPKRPHLLIACMPKSASTFLATAISNVKGFRRQRLIPEYGAREQELCPIRLSRYNRRTYVAQHHIRCSEYTLKLIKHYRLTPAVIVRNLADCVMSIRDHNRKATGPNPMAHYDPTHLALDDAAFEEMIVRFTMPWYIHFYASWLNVPGVPIYDYTQYTADPVRVIADILEAAGHTCDQTTIQQAVQQTRTSEQTRFNVGKAGRGAELHPGAKQALQELLDQYHYLNETPLFQQTRASIG